MEKVKFTDLDGKEIYLYVLSTFSLDEITYAVVKEEDDEDEYIYRLEENEDGYDLVQIEDDAELNEAINCYEELIEENDTRRV